MNFLFIGIATVNNIIFEFSQMFWPKDIEIFHFVPSQISEIGVMTTWLNTGLLSGRKDPYLTTFIQGHIAGTIENFTDDQLKELGKCIFYYYFIIFPTITSFFFYYSTRKKSRYINGIFR